MAGDISEAYRSYLTGLEDRLNHLYVISGEAREKGFDPSLQVECKLARDLADLVEGLVGPVGVAASIRSLSNKIPREELAFKVAEEIVYGKFGHLEPEAAADQSLRSALAILTEGLTAAPLQGIAKVRIKSNFDRTKYLAIYFAGPMRAAGGTDQALTLVIGDFVRRLLGLDRYKPTEDEISRFIEEIRLYERSASHFQYHVPDGELQKALQRLPVEVTGTESDPYEVSTFRNLPRIETNRLRGGALRVVNDGIVGRAPKVSAIIEKLGIQGWDWLREFQKKSEKKSGGFMDDVIAGRPVFSFSSRHGGFRLRYGRSRNTGLSAVGIHPATMLVLQRFLAGGTQMRLELPGKGGVALPVDTIEPPTVRIRDGSVVRVNVASFDNIKDSIDRILFLGDILVCFGDFLYNSRNLVPSGYVEEWWTEDVRLGIVRKFDGHIGESAKATGIPIERFRSFIEDPFLAVPSANEAALISRSLSVPLHPSSTYFWSNLTSVDDVNSLRNWLLCSEVSSNDAGVCSISGSLNSNVKRILEQICVPHRTEDGKITLDGNDAAALAFSLGYSCLTCKPDLSSANSVLESISLLAGVQVRDKAPSLVGARMGRPEKAKRREMKPLVHALFPVGMSGGKQRDAMEAAKKGLVFAEIVKRTCPNCKSVSYKVKCPICGSETVLEKMCPRCGQTLKTNECPACKTHACSYTKRSINLKETIEAACANLSVSLPRVLKGVKGLSNETKTPETIEKGILRAKHDLSVYKDGTIRFDATNAPLTHFKPSEIKVTVEKLKELGYNYDTSGQPLTRPDQICELKLQDIVVPSECGSYLVQVACYIDELLMKVYGLEPYYGIKNANDVIGQLVVGLAPHTCAGILGRIIGFTNLKVCYAHPMWHSAKRRDCDGDEDAVMLALDTLLNFSRKYLPTQIGGIMDAPMLLIPIINPKDVQRQAHDFDVADAYSREFYAKSYENADPRQMSLLIDLVRSRLGTEAQYEGFRYTTPVSDINMGNVESSYKRFKTMVDKLKGQLDLAEKIEAVDARRVALKVLTTHFMRDIAGNMRAFSTQSFRCKTCGKRYRRPPLRGKCSLCGGQLSLTVYRGGIEKYLDAAEYLVEKYNLPPYYSQRISLMQQEIKAMFESRKPKQIKLSDFA